MLLNTIQSRLNERFNAPLMEFYKRRIIFWIDEDNEFTDVINELEIDNVIILKLTGDNNFFVKKLLTVDDLTNNYLIYDPFHYEKVYQADWLYDIKKYSESFHADLISMQMEELHVEPSVKMRDIMKMYTKFFDNKDRKEKLRRIGRTYQSPAQLHIDIMAVLCGINSGTAQDVIIAVLSDNLDEENTLISNITKFGNIEAFWSMVKTYTGYAHSDNRPLNDLATHIIMTAFSQAIPILILKEYKNYISESCKLYCWQLIQEWSRNGDRDKFIEISDYNYIIEKHDFYNIFDQIEMKTLLKIDLLPVIDEYILKYYFKEISENIINVGNIYGVINNRRISAWYDLFSHYYECLYYIAKMEEFYIDNIDGFHFGDSKQAWDFYTANGYLMDSYYRYFLYHFNNTLKSLNHDLDELLKDCLNIVEGLYRDWFLKNITSIWTSCIKDDLNSIGYVSGINKQRDFYKRYVSKNDRTFVIISDALRYEVAIQLKEELNYNTKGKATLESVQSILPSITKFGMAALLPHKELSINNKLEVTVDGKLANNTINRENVLKERNSHSIAITYNDLIQKNQSERRSLVNGKEVIYIYHNTIDATGDKPSTESKVFEACKTTIDELIMIVKIIFNDLSGTNIIITSDHGFLYTNKPLDESLKINRNTFNSTILDSGRRYALTPPETTNDFLLPVNMDREFTGVRIKGYYPQDTVRIQLPGSGENYVHGGISLQEMVVPVIVYKGVRSNNKNYVEVQDPKLELITVNHKISNLMFSLDFLQKQPVSEKVKVCNYTLYFADDNGYIVSNTATIIADKININNSERVFKVDFTLKQMQFDRNKDYSLIMISDKEINDGNKFKIDIAFSDDFGF